MNKIFSIIILFIGIVLIILGINAYESFNSSLTRIFSSLATDRSFWYLIVGVILSILGLLGIFVRRSNL